MSKILKTTTPVTKGDGVLFDPPMGNTSSNEFSGIHHSYRLDGKNYLQWSQLVQTFLKGRGKITVIRII